MCEVIAGMPYFYIEVIAHTELIAGEENATKKIFPLSRMEFFLGSVIAIGFLVQRIALSTFFLIANVFTCGIVQSFRASFCKNIQEGLTFLGAIPLGWTGVFIPQVINQIVLKIPIGGLLIQLV